MLLSNDSFAFVQLAVEPLLFLVLSFLVFYSKQTLPASVMSSKLTKEEQRYKKRVYNCLVIEAGNAVEEVDGKRTYQLHSELTDNYRQLVESFNDIANHKTN